MYIYMDAWSVNMFSETFDDWSSDETQGYFSKFNLSLGIESVLGEHR